MNKLNLCLHTGARTVERAKLSLVATPARTPTWVPIAHERLVSGIIDSLERNHMQVVHESHGVAHDGARYFGLVQVANGKNDDDFGTVIGIRNSHDKSFPAGIVVGAGVFVCDNLTFSGEITLARKHTANVERDLPQLITRAMAQLTEQRDKQHLRFAAYQATEFTDTQAHDLLVRSVDARVLPVTLLPHVLKEWRTPRHQEFRTGGKTGWRLFNAFSECLKGNLDSLPRRTQTLHGLLDVACKLDVMPA